MRKTLIFDFYNTLYNPQKGQLFAGIEGLLRQLGEKYYLILITTVSKERKKQIESCKLENIFNEILIVDRKTLSLFKQKSSKQQTIIIGDRKDEELMIGQKLNLKTIEINPQKENPSITIKRRLGVI